MFLGNPGPEYASTRHNVAWRLIDHLSFRAGLSWKEKFQGAWAEAMPAGRKVLLLRPLTFMNRSGESAARLAGFYRIAPAELLAVHDEIELAFGEVCLSYGGGLAGHQGLKSLAESLGTRDFCRFRLGVSRPRRGTVASYVLGRFTEDEEAVLPRWLEAAARLLEGYLSEGGDPAAQPARRVRLLEES